MKSIAERKAALAERAKTALVTDDDLFVEYDSEPNENGSQITIRRTVWFKAHFSKDRDILHQEDVLTIPRDKLPDLVRDLVSCVTV